MNHIGERIKDFRKKNGLTQEKLADFLGVTYKSVSKWECGLTTPDLALIVPLSKVLGVTTDELLGVKAADARLTELEESYQSALKAGDLEERFRLCTEATREYPADMRWLNRYGWEVWNHAFTLLPDREKFEECREQAIKAFDKVIGNTDDDGIKKTAIKGIVNRLCEKGCKAEARRYMEMYPEEKIVPFAKEELLGMCLEGEEQVRYKQNNLERQLWRLINTLLWDKMGENKDTCTAAKTILDALIPDGNYCSFYDEMSHINIRLAEVAMREGDAEKAMELLRESMRCAKEYDVRDSLHPGEYAFTVPLLDKVIVDFRATYHADSKTESLVDTIKAMSWSEVLEPLRDREDFKSLFQ